MSRFEIKEMRDLDSRSDESLVESAQRSLPNEFGHGGGVRSLEHWMKGVSGRKEEAVKSDAAL